MCLDIVVADLDRQANYVLYLTAGSAGAESESAKTTLTDICADQHIGTLHRSYCTLFVGYYAHYLDLKQRIVCSNLTCSLWFNQV